MVDVDLIILAGEIWQYRSVITLAENLPNDNKLSFVIGEGRRNVFHRKIRFISDKKKLEELLDSILINAQQKYYDTENRQLFVIGHENSHSLGPNKPNDKLGKYSHILEENKDNMGSLSFVDILK